MITRDILMTGSMDMPLKKLDENGCSLELLIGDITEQKVDVIVNAANSRLAGGGGVDGAIHRAAGSALMEETRRRFPKGCPVGGAVLTGAGQLPIQFVIHAVGPIWRGGDAGEAELLRSAYWRSLEIAREQNCHSLAFPSIATGAYGYPLAEAARVAIGTILEFQKIYRGPERVLLALFDQGTFDAYARELNPAK